MTLRIRFGLWTAGLLLAGLAVFGLFVYFSLARGLSTSIDDSLRLSAAQAVAELNIENGQFAFTASRPESLFESEGLANELRQRGLTIRILEPAGGPVAGFGPYSDISLPPEILDLALNQGFAFATLSDPAEGGPIRLFAAQIIDEGQTVGVLQLATSLSGLQDALRRLLSALLAGGSLLALVAAMAGYFLATRALAPIDHITRTARRISAADLSARLGLPATDDEVGRLAATFDAMLARLDDSFRRERQFIADASHELRTPLAAMQTILSVMRERRRTPEEYELALADLGDETDRLQGLVQDLLHLARGESQQAAVRDSVDLSTLLCDVTDSLRPLAEIKGLALTCNAPPGLTLPGDSDSLIRLFVNLVDNAIKFTAKGGIDVASCVDGDTVSVTVADTGIGIPSEHAPHIFDRFYRVDPARTGGGAGLGLAIALDIVRAHGGTLTVDSTPGLGATFTVHLPR